tara:strand:- start:94294 stop:94635 length:342 start_codon:yes stop_codon:yes gene_type:complete
MRNLKSLIIALVFTLGLTSAAFAMDLDSAKAQGLVGEMQNGYVGMVTTNPSPDVKKLVSEVNAGRRSAYQNVAAQTQGASLSDVEKLAAAKLIARTPSGQMVQDAGGKWVKKP